MYNFNIFKNRVGKLSLLFVSRHYETLQSWPSDERECETFYALLLPFMVTEFSWFYIELQTSNNSMIRKLNVN